MAKIAIFNQKGGVGKTTTTLNLSAALTRRGVRPLSIDLDAQAHLSFICGVAIDTSDDSIVSFYERRKPLSGLIRKGNGGWEIIPSHVELTRVDTQYGKGPNALNRLNLGIVGEHLNTTRPILIDCCPMLGVLSLNAIFACDRVLVPVSADFLAVKGVQQVEKTLRALEQVLKKRLPRRYVLTRFDSRRKMSWEIQQTLVGRYGDEVCKTRISESVSIAESPHYNQDVFAHAPRSRGAKDYDELLSELISTGFIEPPKLDDEKPPVDWKD